MIQNSLSNLSLEPETQLNHHDLQPTFLWKLWIYTNYDCNLKCSYCVAKSGPNVPRRALGLDNVKRLVDEAIELGFEHVFLHWR